jgi:hypothetical protein
MTARCGKAPLVEFGCDCHETIRGSDPIELRKLAQHILVRHVDDVGAGVAVFPVCLSIYKDGRRSLQVVAFHPTG